MSSFEKTVGDIPLPDVRYTNSLPLKYNNEAMDLLPGYELYRSLTYSKQARAFRTNYVEWSPDMKKLLIDETAANIGIPLSFRSLKEYGPLHRGHLGGTGPYKGLSPWGVSPYEVAIDPTFNQDRTTFGHEMGHYFIQEVLNYEPQPWDYFSEEQFCEYFGRTLAIPESALWDIEHVDEETIKQLVIECDVDPHSVVLRLIEAGKLPDNVHIDSYTSHKYAPGFASKVERSSVCLYCSISHGALNCPNAHLSKAALFDFTDRAWSSKFSHCSGEFSETSMESRCHYLTAYYQSRMTQLALFPPLAPAPNYL